MQLREYQLGNLETSDTVNKLMSSTQSTQYAFMARQIQLASELIYRQKPTLFLSFDNTPAGDFHTVSAIYKPCKDVLMIEVPEEPHDVYGRDGKRYSRKGGRFPTVLHTIEMFVVANKLAGTHRRNLTTKPEDITYPRLEFISELAEPNKFTSQVEHYGNSISEVIVIPLTYQPETSNVLFFNKNAQGRDVNRTAIAQAHYDAVQADCTIASVLLRHTMLLEGKVAGGNKVIAIGVMNGWETKQYRLFRTARMDASWITPLQSPKFLGNTVDDNGHITRRYSLNPQETQGSN